MKTKTLRIKIYCRFQRHARSFFQKSIKYELKSQKKGENLNKRVLSHFSCACRCTKCHKLVFEDSSMSCDFTRWDQSEHRWWRCFITGREIKHDHHSSFLSNPPPARVNYFIVLIAQAAKQQRWTRIHTSTLNLPETLIVAETNVHASELALRRQDMDPAHEVTA